MKPKLAGLSPATRNAILIADSASAALSSQHPDWSIDKLLQHPRAAMAICKIVRRQMGINDADNVILCHLLNGRKRGWIEPVGRPTRRMR